MPSKQDIDCPNEQKKDYFPCEVEDLVAAINRNLQLKSRPCISGVCSKQKRVSPYAVPVRTICRKSDKENSLDIECNCKFCLFKSKTPSTGSGTDDPYEMLQDLLREGSLIKEAVKRLQLHPTKPKEANFYDTDDLDVRSPHLCEV